MKIIIVFILLFTLFNFSCKNPEGKNSLRHNGFEIKPEFKKYERFIEDARLKIYLKTGVKKAYIKDANLNPDSMYLAEMNLSLYGCEQKNNGLLVSFVYMYGDSSIYFDFSPSATSTVFYRNNNINDWFFAYGDLNVIYFDLPEQIDTMQVWERLKSNKSLNAWFKKRLEDSIANRK